MSVSQAHNNDIWEEAPYGRTPLGKKNSDEEIISILLIPLHGKYSRG